MRNNKKQFLILAVILFSRCSFAENQTVFYDPQLVQLAGVIETKTFPGAPNYENIKDGDAAETSLYLILDHPVNVSPAAETNELVNIPEKNVRVIQLVDVRRSAWNKLHDGEHVFVRGMLFHKLNGHHHSRVLMMVK